MTETWYEHPGSSSEGIRRVVVELDEHGNRVREEEFWWGGEKVRWALWSRGPGGGLRSWFESDEGIRQQVIEHDDRARVAEVRGLDAEVAGEPGAARTWRIVCDRDGEGRLLRERRLDAEGTLVESLECAYAGDGRLARVQRERPGGEPRIVYALEHDGAGRVVLESAAGGPDEALLPCRAFRYEGDRLVAVRFHDELGRPYAVDLRTQEADGELERTETFLVPLERLAGTCGPLDGLSGWSDRRVLSGLGCLRTVSERAGGERWVRSRIHGPDGGLWGEDRYEYELDERGNWILCTVWTLAAGTEGGGAWSETACILRELEYGASEPARE